MSSTSNGRSTTGVNIALAGLSFQVATLVIFTMTVVDYMFRSRHVWRNSSINISWRFKNFCGWLSLATLLILIRCCYRVYELNEGYSRNSEALRDQPLFIGLEGM
jgi:RTA1 like protein